MQLWRPGCGAVAAQPGGWGVIKCVGLWRSRSVRATVQACRWAALHGLSTARRRACGATGVAALAQVSAVFGLLAQVYGCGFGEHREKSQSRQLAMASLLASFFFTKTLLMRYPCHIAVLVLGEGLR